MAESFDYVAFAQNFEKRHGRPPTSKELETGIDPLEGIVRTHTAEETQAEMARINASYKPSFSERLKGGLSFLGRNGFKALILVIQTPIYLTLLFFNLIKSAIAVTIMFIVTKAVLGTVIAGILEWRNINNLSSVSSLSRFFIQDFMTDSLEPILFTEVDFVICIVFVWIFALLLTFSKTDI